MSIRTLVGVTPERPYPGRLQHGRYLIAATLALAGSGAIAAPARPTPHLASTALTAADGTAKGRAWIETTRGRSQMRVEVEGLSPGVHGIHLHAMGRCDAPDFTSAGGHLNPAGKMHGSLNPQGAHLGDLPNVTVGADGKGTLTVPLAGPAAGLGRNLFDADGTALIVHATADDYRTDPSGNSGGRIACGVLRRG